MMGLTSHISCVNDAFFFLSHFFFFDDESDNDGSGSRSSDLCYFSFSSGKSVGRVSISKSVGHVSVLF